MVVVVVGGVVALRWVWSSPSPLPLPKKRRDDDDSSSLTCWLRGVPLLFSALPPSWRVRCVVRLAGARKPLHNRIRVFLFCSLPFSRIPLRRGTIGSNPCEAVG